MYFGRSVTGGRWPVIGGDNGDNMDNFAGGIYSGANIRTGNVKFSTQ